MNALRMKGDWKKNAGKLKQQFANLTDDDLLFRDRRGYVHMPDGRGYRDTIFLFE
jgi:hypothetical protein